MKSHGQEQEKGHLDGRGSLGLLILPVGPKVQHHMKPLISQTHRAFTLLIDGSMPSPQGQDDCSNFSQAASGSHATGSCVYFAFPAEIAIKITYIMYELY